MRRIGFGLVVVAVALAVLVMVWGMPKRDARAVADDFVEGIAQQKAEQVADTLCSAPHGSAQLYATAGRGIRAFEVENVLQTGDQADAYLRGMAEMESEAVPLAWVLHLKRIEGRWCVSEMVNQALLVRE